MSFMESKCMTLHKKGEVLYLTFPLFEKAGGVKHAFSTRFGGKSRGHCSTMSFGFSLGDDENAVAQNFDIFCSAFGAKAQNCVLSQQTHTANLRVVTSLDKGKGLFCERDYTDIDGLITNEPDLILVTQYADCTPLAFFDPVRRVVATSHAGWRGTVQEIGKKTVEMMRTEFGCEPSDILCGIGPNIGKCCYEVDNPVIDKIKELSYLDFDACYTDKGKGKYMLDLKETNRQILLSAGVRPENIDVSELCTCCNSDTFHSHRASGGKRGTLALMIGLE